MEEVDSEESLQGSAAEIEKLREEFKSEIQNLLKSNWSLNFNYHLELIEIKELTEILRIEGDIFSELFIEHLLYNNFNLQMTKWTRWTDRN